jgi:hypothetical protein
MGIRSSFAFLAEHERLSSTALHFLAGWWAYDLDVEDLGTIDCCFILSTYCKPPYICSHLLVLRPGTSLYLSSNDGNLSVFPDRKFVHTRSQSSTALQDHTQYVG